MFYLFKKIILYEFKISIRTENHDFTVVHISISAKYRDFTQVFSDDLLFFIIEISLAHFRFLLSIIKMYKDFSVEFYNNFVDFTIYRILNRILFTIITIFNL